MKTGHNDGKTEAIMGWLMQPLLTTITRHYTFSFALIFAVEALFSSLALFIHTPTSTSLNLPIPPSLSTLPLIYNSPVKNCALPIPKLQSSFSFLATLITRSVFGTPHSFSNRSASAAYTSCFCCALLPCWNIWMRMSFSVRGRESPVSSKMSS